MSTAGCFSSNDGDDPDGGTTGGGGSSDDDTDSDDGGTVGSGDDGSSDGSSSDDANDGSNGGQQSFDVEVKYDSVVATSNSEEYDLPERDRDGWQWIVVDFEVLSGELSMQELWFNAYFETEERLYTTNHSTSDIKYGIESRGSVQKDGRGIALYDYPPVEADLVGWNLSMVSQNLGGENILLDGPQEAYPPVSVEYSVERTDNPGIFRSEPHIELQDGETWALVTLNVTDGVLNMEDVWFRSQLLTESRSHEIDHESPDIERGVRSRGLVKPGHKAHALYRIGTNETIDRWRYSDQRQDVDITRV